jgi:hypothetical protein
MRSQIDADIDRTDIRQEGDIVTIDIPDTLEGGNGVLLDMSPKQLRILQEEEKRAIERLTKLGILPKDSIMELHNHQPAKINILITQPPEEQVIEVHPDQKQISSEDNSA